MRSSRFWLYYLLLAAVQILLCNSLHITQLLTLWFLPMMVLCIPIRYDTLAVLPIAFATGMAVDFLTQGVPGLCTVALLPVAFSRNLIIRIVFGGEVFSRGEDISIRRQGILKMTLAIMTATASGRTVRSPAPSGSTARVISCPWPAGPSSPSCSSISFLRKRVRYGNKQDQQASDRTRSRGDAAPREDILYPDPQQQVQGQRPQQLDGL